MFKKSIGVWLLSLGLSCSSPSPSPPPSLPSSPSVDFEGGKNFMNRFACRSCHFEFIKFARLVIRLDLIEFKASVYDTSIGHPRYQDAFSDEELENLYYYIRSNDTCL